MKILFVNKFLHPNGGSETYIFKLSEYFKSMGHEVQFFGMEHENRCVGNNAEQYTANMDFHGGSKLAKLTYPIKTIYSAEARRKMNIVLDDFKPDVVHLNNINYQLTPSVILAVKDYEGRSGNKVKIVMTAHDEQLVCPNHLMFTNDKICEECLGGKYYNCVKNRCIHGSAAKSLIGAMEGYYWKYRKAYQYIDSIICPTEFLKSKLDTNPLLAGKTVTIQNFAEPKEKLNIKKENCILYFGRFSTEKGIELVLAAKDYHFTCAGCGPFEEQVDSAENITHLGFQTGAALETLIRTARCTVLPSICIENCPFSVLESITLGTPVIAAATGGVPELVEDGKTGLLFEVGNQNAFEEALNTIINDDALAAELSENCMKKEFDTVEGYCEKLMEIYKD